jgi:hypothetical protein
VTFSKPRRKCHKKSQNGGCPGTSDAFRIAALISLFIIVVQPGTKV